MGEKIDNLQALIKARNEFILETDDEKTEIFKQTLKDIETIIAQRCHEICEEFKKNNFFEGDGNSECQSLNSLRS